MIEDGLAAKKREIVGLLPMGTSTTKKILRYLSIFLPRIMF